MTSKAANQALHLSLSVTTTTGTTATIKGEESSSLFQSPNGDNNIIITNAAADDYNDDPLCNDEGKGLIRRKLFSPSNSSAKENMRPYWLGLGLALILFAFWVLDSLKDPIFAILVEGKLHQHQPPAKLCSVATTLIIVCMVEFGAYFRKQQTDGYTFSQPTNQSNQWRKMSMERERPKDDDRVSASIFIYVGLSYAIIFSLVPIILGFHPNFSRTADTFDSGSSTSTMWHILGYALYSTIESFGSLAVATFWSYANSTLSLHDAERFYGLIIAIAQVGAIGGSSMVTTQYWSAASLIWVACLVMVLQILVMMRYDKVYPPTSGGPEEPPPTPKNEADAAALWSGVYLILRHNYVLLIMGVSCLYEVSLTCLDYQMKVLGWTRFEERHSGITFAQFMGRYGQLTNGTSLIISSVVFPYLIRRMGLRYTIRIFPTLLLIATIIAYGAAPGNLAVLFLSLSILKAMTYSMHDPAKELLYIPTSNAIKFRAKFWIDVVGVRFAKAVGSSINTMAGSVENSVRIGSVPSLLSAGALWYVAYKVGNAFDALVKEHRVVGHDGHILDGVAYRPLSSDADEFPLTVGRCDEDEQDDILDDDDVDATSGGDVELKLTI
jgi:TLC ATP/ADP transporter